MMHHVAMCVTAFLALSPLGLFYATFFAGLAEVSSVPLVFVDLFHPKHFADLLKFSPRLDSFNMGCRVCFALLFMIFRAVWWPLVMLLYILPDGIAMLGRG